LGSERGRLARLVATGRRIHVKQVDVADSAAVGDAFPEAVATLCRVDACFANAGAGGSHRSGFAAMPNDEWDRLL
jgi:hypothetical protein